MSDSNCTLKNSIQTPVQSNNASNPFVYSPSTTHMSLMLTKKKFIPAKQEKKGNKTLFNQASPYHHQPQFQQPSLIWHPCLQLSKVKQNLNKKFSNEEGRTLMTSKENKDNHLKDNSDSNASVHNELISKSNSQSSINEEKALIDNLTQKEYSYSKKSKTQSSKKVSYGGTIELTNEHTGGIDQFKSFKESEVWLKPINDNLLLNEEDDEYNCSDEEILTQSTQSVIKELCDGINQLTKDLASQDPKSKLLSRNLY